MAVLTRPLSAPEVQKAKPTDKDYELFDGQGLTLFIRTNGKKIWRFRYKRPGSTARTTITLGHYPAMSLASARTLHAEHLTLLVKGIDPKKQEQEEAERERLAVDSLFINVATRWFAVKKTKISVDYADDIWKSLERDVFPAIGQTPVIELKAHTLIAALEPVRLRGALETLHRLTQRINEVMKFAINTGLLDANPASTIDEAFVKPKKRHMPTIRPERLPAARMKMKREHQVPLSPQAMAVLEQLKPLSKHSPFVFPGRVKRCQPMHSETVNRALWRMGYGGELVSHGFRALGSTTLNEAGSPPDVVEAALAHVDANPTRAAYNRSTYMAQRIELMDWWGRKVSDTSMEIKRV